MYNIRFLISLYRRFDWKIYIGIAHKVSIEFCVTYNCVEFLLGWSVIRSSRIGYGICHMVVLGYGQLSVYYRQSMQFFYCWQLCTPEQELVHNSSHATIHTAHWTIQSTYIHNSFTAQMSAYKSPALTSTDLLRTCVNSLVLVCANNRAYYHILLLIPSTTYLYGGCVRVGVSILFLEFHACQYV